MMKTNQQIVANDSGMGVAIPCEGRVDKSIAICREAVKSQPHSSHAQTGLGWAIDRQLKEEAAKAEPDRSLVTALIREYLGLTLVQKPSLLHSMILTRVAHLQGCLGPLYCSFIRKWDPRYLREQDFVPFRPEGKDETYPSLAEKAGIALGKSIKGLKRDALPDGVDPDWICRWLGELAARFPDQIWLQYHHAKSLLLTGNSATARSALLPIVRAKQSEFWAWAALADTFESGTRDRFACLCRALLCKVKDVVFLKGVLRQISGELARAGESDASGRLTQHQGQEPDPALLRELTPVFERYAPHADALVFADIPWMDAIVSGRVDANADIRGALFVIVAAGDGLKDLRVKSGKFPCLDNARLGSPVSVRVIRVEDRDRIADACVREGQPWDLIPEQTGIVKHVNLQRELVAIASGVDATTLAHFDRFPESRELVPGDVVAVRCLGIREDALPVLVSVRRSDDVPSATFCKRFDGHLRMTADNFSGLVDDVYVHGLLIPQPPVAGQPVHGIAVLDTNHKTGRKGWKALTFLLNK